MGKLTEIDCKGPKKIFHCVNPKMCLRALPEKFPLNVVALIDRCSDATHHALLEMTVSYTPSVGTATKFGAFGKVLLM